MTTITINTYDPEARFNMSGEEAKEFFAFVEDQVLMSIMTVAPMSTKRVSALLKNAFRTTNKRCSQ